jgi:hypothetical protein
MGARDWRASFLSYRSWSASSDVLLTASTGLDEYLGK